ncbi:unnamed protein product, partial [Symbiodinium sp. CCMP2456]
MIAYLSAKGITNSGLFLHYFKDNSKIQAFFDPLRTGYDIAGNVLKRSDDERLILEAATKVALDELTVKHAAMMAHASTTPSGTTGTSGAVATASDPSDKIPKTLPKNYWAEYVKDFESVVLLGRNREFPSHLLLGTFTKAMRQVPEPQKLVTLLDAIDAIKWALMFARWCDEHDATIWSEFWQNMCRDYPNRFPQVRAFFDKAFLHVTLQMRAGKSFKEASGEAMSWPKQDELNRPVPFEVGEHKKVKGDPGFKGDSKGFRGQFGEKGSESGKGKTFQQRQWLQNQPYRTEFQHSPAVPASRAPSTLLHATEVQESRQRSPVRNSPFSHSSKQLTRLSRPARLHVKHWGDALASDASQVAQYLHQQCPDDTLVVICSSPPCTDFSQIRSSQPGLKGTEGCKFRKWVQWFKTFRSVLKRQYVFLLENVVPSASTHAELDQLVGVPSFVIDASSWSLISRPRLWWTNTDAKYSRPLSKQQFRSFNKEISKEQHKDRFQGPFEASQVASDEDAFAARAFAVVQQDKVRRADDWRRSGHNSTVFVKDTPPYAGTQTVLNLVQAAADIGDPTLAALDHDGAYRALPVRDPKECFVFVPSQDEPSVFQHLVLPFGGTGSVWSYLRVADVICFLTITLAFIPAAHFVDDYFYSEWCGQSLTTASQLGREAAHLAGKLNFVCSWVFGGRPHLLYADAFVTLAGNRQAATRTRVPVSILGKVATTKAFIFWLEALAQLFPQFEDIWEQLLELTYTSVKPHAALFDELVNQLA